jgi:hypothetical protein
LCGYCALATQFLTQQLCSFPWQASHAELFVLFSNWKSCFMETHNLYKDKMYKGFSLHSVVSRPNSMAILEKPSLIGGHHIQSLYAKKPQPIVDKRKK